MRYFRHKNMRSLAKFSRASVSTKRLFSSGFSSGLKQKLEEMIPQEQQKLKDLKLEYGTK